MVVSLKNNIDIVCIKHRSQLSTKNHTVCIGVVKTGTINILMDGYDTPFCIRISFYSFFDGVLMFCNVIIVGVRNDEESVTIAVVVITACCCLTVFCIVRVIEMVGIIRIQRIVVTDGSCYRKRFQSIGAQIRSVLFFFCFTCFIYLVTCRDDKINI